MKPAEQDNKPGITSSQAVTRLLEYGPNELPERKPPGLLRIFVCQFKSPFVYVLLAAALRKMVHVSCNSGAR